MAVIYVGLGLTGAGKTELANYLETKYGVHHFHPIGFAKRQWERLLQKPAGFLDTQEGKAFPIPGKEDKTMQEMMIAAYHFYKEWMPRYSTLNMAVELPEILAEKDMCVVSLRNHAEVDELLEIAKYDGHKLIVFSIHRDKARRASSDEHYEDLKERLRVAADAFLPINNNYSLDHFQQRIDDIIKYCQ